MTLVLALLSFAGCAAPGGKPPHAASVTQAQFTGSNATPQMLASARRVFRLWYYKGCEKIDILELVSLSPESMRGRSPLLAGDRWTEKWKIDACGTIAVHAIEFALIDVGGTISNSLNVKPAE